MQTPSSSNDAPSKEVTLKLRRESIQEMTSQDLENAWGGQNTSQKFTASEDEKVGLQ